MLKIIGGILLLGISAPAAAAQANEITLSCTGTSKKDLAYSAGNLGRRQYEPPGRPIPVIETLIVDMENQTVEWIKHGVARFDPLYKIDLEHVVRFKWEFSSWCDDKKPMPDRAPRGAPSCNSASFEGSLDRTTGVAQVNTLYQKTASWNDHYMEGYAYELQCKPAKRMF